MGFFSSISKAAGGLFKKAGSLSTKLTGLTVGVLRKVDPTGGMIADFAGKTVGKMNASILNGIGGMLDKSGGASNPVMKTRTGSANPMMQRRQVYNNVAYAQPQAQSDTKKAAIGIGGAVALAKVFGII